MWTLKRVTRQIILAKKPSTRPPSKVLAQAELGKSPATCAAPSLEHVTEDEQLMTDDYPILPVRRRFWERVLRTIDTTGTVSHQQLLAWCMRRGGEAMIRPAVGPCRSG